MNPRWCQGPLLKVRAMMVREGVMEAMLINLELCSLPARFRLITEE